MLLGEGHRVLVLAAGRGTRMGGPKVLMSVGGVPWWRVQLERLNAAGLEQTWLVSPEVRSVFESEPDAPQQLVEADSSEPMFETLMRGLRSLDDKPCPGVFVLPIDVPAAGPAVWRELAVTGRVAVPVCDGRRGHPLHLPRLWIREHLLASPPPPGARLDTLIRAFRMEVAVDDPAVGFNLNTEADVQQWLESQREQA